MKKLALLTLFFCTSLWAQKQTISTNIPAYGINSINVQFERQLVKPLAVSLQFSHLKNGDLPFKNIIEKISNSKNDAILTDVFNNVQLKGNSFVLETRLYLGKSGFSGFYFAPYYKHSYYNINDLHLNYDHDQQVSVDGDIQSNSVGLLLGTKWQIGKHFTIDWWIGGGHFGSGKVNFSGDSLHDLTGFEKEIEMAVNDISKNFFHNVLDVDVDGKDINIKGTTDWYGLRSGLALGFSF